MQSLTRPPMAAYDLAPMWKRRLIQRLLRFRYLSFFLVLGITVFATTQAFPLTFLSSIEAWFLEGDPSLDVYQEFLKLGINEERLIHKLIL